MKSLLWKEWAENLKWAVLALLLFAGALALFGASAAGIPVSTTHTITGSIVGVGSTRRLSAVRWGVARRIVWAWVLTMPASALVAALAWRALRAAGMS